MYKVESDFTYKGYRCVVIFTDMGHRCGYVGIPLGHELYKKNYGDYLDVTKTEIENQEIGNRGIIPLLISAFDDDERVKMDVYFNVHGGLTYSDDYPEYPVESNLWWLGFDCGHYQDGKDLKLMEEYWGDDSRIQRRIEIEREFPNYYPVRSKEYVEKECKSLVDQIIYLISKPYVVTEVINKYDSYEVNE